MATNSRSHTLALRGRSFVWGERTYLMGILNVTPDSFSDGGQFFSVDAAVTQAQRLIAAGADVLDVGGQSTRPQAEELTLAEELDRVIPVIQALRTGTAAHPPIDSPISIDTTKAAVAEAAIRAGADLVNDVSGATFDAEMLSTVSSLGVPIVLMHLRGTPKTMQQLTDYKDLIADIATFLEQQAEAAIAHGIPAEHVILDPGIGFAKTYAQNLELLRRLSELRSLGYPLLVGTSRKSFIGHILNQPDAQKRVWGTAATCCAAIANGADILRVHDVAEMREVCQTADAIWRV